MSVAYHVEFPEYFDSYSGEIASKGTFSDLLIIVGEQKFRPVFYDAARLVQDVEEEFHLGSPCFAEANIVIVPRLRRDEMLAAIAELARSDFSSLQPLADEN